MGLEFSLNNSVILITDIVKLVDTFLWIKKRKEIADGLFPQRALFALSPSRYFEAVKARFFLLILQTAVDSFSFQNMR